MTEQERIPRPEEVLEDQDGLTPEQKLRPMRCRAASKTDTPRPREATSWVWGSYALCDEHARVEELAREANDWGLAEEITRDWLRIARAWQLEELEQLLAINAHDRAKEGSLKAETRMRLAIEIADAPRKGEERPALTREQDEEIRRLMRHSDGLVDAYTSIEDILEGQIEKGVRRRILGVLASEQDLAQEEFDRYRAELGLKD